MNASHISQKIKRIQEGNQVFSTLPNILQAFVQHYEQVLKAQDPFDAQNWAMHGNGPIRTLTISKGTMWSTTHRRWALGGYFPNGQWQSSRPWRIPLWILQNNMGYSWPGIISSLSWSSSYQFFGDMVNTGNIKYILKSGNLEEITNQRPITMLHFSYKIIMKVLALFLRNLLPLILQPE